MNARELKEFTHILLIPGAKYVYGITGTISDQDLPSNTEFVDLNTIPALYKLLEQTNKSILAYIKGAF